MNTQIASFTQLQYDSALYAKPSYTRTALCEYPDGMVDPYSLFWEMYEMALRMRNIAADVLHCGGFFDNFASTMKTLEGISVRQASNQQLTAGQLVFMRSGHGVGTSWQWSDPVCRVVSETLLHLS